MYSLQAAITILQSDKVITKDSAIGLNFKGFRGWPLLTGAAIDDTISIWVKNSELGRKFKELYDRISIVFRHCLLN